MKIRLNRLNNAVLFEGVNESGNVIRIDGSEAVGGVAGGMRPTEALLVSLAACSSIDVVVFLKKMRQELKDISVEVTGERAEDQVPKVFTKIHLHFLLWGNIAESKAAKAVGLSVEKYCTIAKMIEQVATISYDFKIKGAV